MTVLKRDQIRDMRDQIARDMFGITTSEAQEKHICVRCREAVDLQTMKMADAQEYRLSALCVACAVIIIGPDLTGKSFNTVVLTRK